VSDRHVPAVVFTDPEVATVGLSEAEARQSGHDPVVGRMAFSNNGRALSAGQPDGFVRVVVDEQSEAVLGAQVVGRHASELVGELAVALDARLTARDVGGTIHAHPTLSEAVLEACEDAIDEAIHVP
jgi:dihydrolipoamide dehydrogenase